MSSRLHSKTSELKSLFACMQNTMDSERFKQCQDTIHTGLQKMPRDYIWKLQLQQAQAGFAAYRLHVEGLEDAEQLAALMTCSPENIFLSKEACVEILRRLKPIMHQHEIADEVTDNAVAAEGILIFFSIDGVTGMGRRFPIVRDEAGGLSRAAREKQNRLMKQHARSQAARLRSRCNQCGKQGQLVQCSKCQVTSYCGRECQRANWPVHKGVCDYALCHQRYSQLSDDMDLFLNKAYMHGNE